MSGLIHSFLQVVQGDPKCQGLFIHSYNTCSTGGSKMLGPVHSFLHVVQGDPKCRGLFIHTYM